jgi:hypothetical protein
MYRHSEPTDCGALSAAGSRKHGGQRSHSPLPRSPEWRTAVGLRAMPGRLARRPRLGDGASSRTPPRTCSSFLRDRTPPFGGESHVPRPEQGHIRSSWASPGSGHHAQGGRVGTASRHGASHGRPRGESPKPSCAWEEEGAQATATETRHIQETPQSDRKEAGSDQARQESHGAADVTKEPCAQYWQTRRASEPQSALI